jgi:hypothetical protein
MEQEKKIYKWLSEYPFLRKVDLSKYPFIKNTYMYGLSSTIFKY